MTAVREHKLSPEQRYYRWPHHLLPVGHTGQQIGRDPRIIPDPDLARLLKCDRVTVQRIRHYGLDYWWADRLATRVLGRHPCEVWPNWWYRTKLLMLMGDDEAVA